MSPTSKSTAVLSPGPSIRVMSAISSHVRTPVSARTRPQNVAPPIGEPPTRTYEPLTSSHLTMLTPEPMFTTRNGNRPPPPAVEGGGPEPGVAAAEGQGGSRLRVASPVVVSQAKRGAAASDACGGPPCFSITRMP